MNRPCIISGNVGQAPELNTTPNGAKVANFSLALYGGKDEDGGAITTWVRVTAWKDLAEAVSQQVHKGDKIQCQGYLMPARLYVDKEKTTRASLELTAFSVKALEFAEKELAGVV